MPGRSTEIISGYRSREEHEASARGVVEAFPDSGAGVAINGRATESTTAAITEAGAGERMVPVQDDVGMAAGCEGVVKTAIKAPGGLDILVHSAGVATSGPIEDFDEGVRDQEATLFIWHLAPA